MIFATFGTQLPFDRPLAVLDQWAAANRQVNVNAQTGRTNWTFAHLDCATNLGQSAFAKAFASAQVIVAHAGMGSILQAGESGKPIILMPRRAILGEHRNDHQIDTATEMSVLPKLTVVHGAAGLAAALDRILTQPQAACPGGRTLASAPLISNIRDIIFAKPKQENQA